MNVVALVGRLGQDPELRTTQSGTSVTSFSLAVPRSYIKQGEERQSDWIDVQAWRGTAEFVCKHFSKGQEMTVTGSIQTSTWQDKTGTKRKSVQVVASQVGFVGGKKESSTPKTSQEPVQDYAQGDLASFDDLFDEDAPF